jgi:hypothetical protein
MLIGAAFRDLARTALLSFPWSWDRLVNWSGLDESVAALGWRADLRVRRGYRTRHLRGRREPRPHLPSRAGSYGHYRLNDLIGGVGKICLGQV